jgi:hypothetical protein
LVAALTFIGASPLLGRFLSDDLSLLPPVPQGQRLPTLWILLDETSFGAAEKLVQPLRGLGLHVTLDALTPAGQNTLDIVPSMFARRIFGPDAAPCGPNVICSSRHALDFSRVAVGRTGVDLVGVYHPYCAIKGWRSCARDHRRQESWSHQWNELLCAGSRWLGTETECLRTFASHDLEVRAHAVESTLNAPFWQLGGDLMVHILLPHLPATASPQPSLAMAYETNLDVAAQMLLNLGQRLKSTFPDFRLVVYSDHPLRAIDRCNSAYNGHCERPAKYSEPFQVPLIVASPVPFNLHAPASNLTIFDIALINPKP